MIRAIVILAASATYWGIALMLGFLAVGAPCGLAPGAWCEERGPNALGAMLGSLGPVGVLAIAAIIYLGAFWLIRRQRKSL